MTEYLQIDGRKYRVASNVMGVTLGYLEAHDGKVPQQTTTSDWILLLVLSIYYGEKMEGRESDITADKLLLMDPQTAMKLLQDFQGIYSSQNPPKEDADSKKE